MLSCVCVYLFTELSQANLMTGAVNLSIKTIYASPQEGFLVVFAYMFLLSLLVSVLLYFELRIKL